MHFSCISYKSLSLFVWVGFGAGCLTNSSSGNEQGESESFPPLENPISNMPRACKASSVMGPRPEFQETVLDIGAKDKALRVTGLAVGLLDSDSYPDLAISSSISTTRGGHTPASTMVTIRKGKGEGMFSAPSMPFELGRGSRPIMLADFDGNGRHDMATSGVYCVMTRSGRCQEIRKTPLGPGGPRFFGYVNHDAYIDSLYVDTNNMTVVSELGSHQAIFDESVVNFYEGPHFYWTVFGDVDGDEHVDLVGLEYHIEGPGSSEENLLDSIQVLRGDGSGHFSWERSWARKLPEKTVYIAGGDFNCDGLLDIASAISNADDPDDVNSRVQIWLSKGDGFEEPMDIEAESPVWIAVGDMNGDGHHDLVVANYYFRQQKPEGYPVVLLGDGTGHFPGEPIRLMSQGSTQNLHVVSTGDVNNDGLDDVMAGDKVYSDQVSIWVAEL